MVDLAQVETRKPSGSTPSATFSEGTTLPRVNTQRPALEVNALIQRPAGGNAEALSKLLGIANDLAQNVAGDIQTSEDQKNAGQAAIDFAEGSKNPDLFAKSRAYYQAYQREGAKNLLLTQISPEATQAASEALNKPNATLQDVDAAIEGIFKKYTHDSQGQLLDFGTSETKLMLAKGLDGIRSELLPQAQSAIKKQMDTKVLSTRYRNMIAERHLGAPIGGDAPAVDPLAPLPPNPERTPTHVLGTLMSPFRGFDTVRLTGVIGDKRNGHIHNGEDYPVPDGTTIQAPMAGTVVESNFSKDGGNQVRVQLANGAIVGFAHLSDRNVKVGDKVNAGDVLGLSGQTGDATGPHVHMTVLVNGQHVSPRHYFANHSSDRVIVASGDEPQLNAEVATAAPSPKPGFDVEGFLQGLPPSISKGDAKGFLLTQLYSDAKKTGDFSLLNGLEDSKRADGTPSFNPEEQLQIVRARETIRAEAQKERDDQTQKLQTDNENKVLLAYAKGNTVSDSWLAEKGAQGLLSAHFVYAMKDHNDALIHEQQAEARQEARTAQAEADASIDTDVNTQIAGLRAGLPSSLASTSVTDLTRNFQHGDYGPVGSHKALARYNALRQALEIGQRTTEQTPEFARYSAMLDQNYRPATGGNGTFLLARPTNGSTLDSATYHEMVAFYEEQVHKGTDPGDAYRKAVSAYAKKPAPAGAPGSVQAQLQSIGNQLRAMQARRAAAGIHD